MASTGNTGAGSGSATGTSSASSTAEMWSQAAAAYQAFNNSNQWYNTGNSAYSTNMGNQWDANNTAFQTNWSTGNTGTGAGSNYNTSTGNQWYNQSQTYNTGTGDASSYATGSGNNQNNQSAYTANTAAFSTNAGYVDNSSNYNTEGYSTSGFGNSGYGNQSYGNQGYGNQGFGHKGNDQKGSRGFGNHQRHDSRRGGNSGGGYGGGGRGGGGMRNDRDRDRNNGGGRMGGGRDGGRVNRFSDQGGRMGGRDRDMGGKRKDPFQGAPELGRPFIPKRLKSDKDMNRMAGMIENVSSGINSVRRGWNDMDPKELNKKVEFLLNQQMMLIDKQSHMADTLDRREMDMHAEIDMLLKERDDLLRHMDEIKFANRGFDEGFGPGPMSQMGPPGPRWSRDSRDNSWISPEESVMRFTEYLLFFQPKSTNMQTLVRAVISSRLNIKVELRYKEVERDGERIFRGHLLLGYFVLNHTYKKTLEEMRSHLFDRAIYTLMTKTLGYIAVNSNRVMEAKKNEDRLIRGDEMSEVNGSEAVKIWSSKPGKEPKSEKEDEKSGKPDEEEEKKDTEKSEAKTEDSETKDESKEAGEGETESQKDGTDESSRHGDEDNKDGSSRDKNSSRDRSSSHKRDRKDRRSRGGHEEKEKDRHGRQRKPRSEYKFFSPRLRERLEMMRDDLPVGPHIRSIHDMSLAAKCNNVGITLTVYRRSPNDYLLETYDAELYADEIFLGKGHGRDVREAHKYAFIHSRDEMLSAPMNELLSARKRLIELNVNDPLLLDVQYRGPFHDVGNNMSNLKMAREWPIEEEKSLDDLIILEDNDDRKKNFYKTLEISATQNSMMLEWVRSGRDDTMPHRCQLFLEKNKIADVKSPNKLKAKNLSAFKALRKLKKTQTIIRYSVDTTKKPLLNFETLKEKAKIRENEEKARKAAEGGKEEEVKEEKMEEETGETTAQTSEPAAADDTDVKKEESEHKEEDNAEDKEEDNSSEKREGRDRRDSEQRKDRRSRRDRDHDKDREKERRHVDKYVDAEIAEAIDGYIALDDIEGVLLGADLPLHIKKRASNIAVDKGLLVMPCGMDDMIILNKETYMAQNLLKKLQENNNQLGRYQLVQLKVPGAEKPLRLVEESEDEDEDDVEHHEKDDGHARDDDVHPRDSKDEDNDGDNKLSEEPMEGDRKHDD